MISTPPGLLLLLNHQFFLKSQILHSSALSGELRIYYTCVHMTVLEAMFPSKVHLDTQTLFCQAGLWFCTLHHWDQIMYFCVCACVCIHCYFGQSLPHSFPNNRRIHTHAHAHTLTHNQKVREKCVGEGDEFGEAYRDMVSPSFVFLYAAVHVCLYLWI